MFALWIQRAALAAAATIIAATLPAGAQNAAAQLMLATTPLREYKPPQQ